MSEYVVVYEQAEDGGWSAYLPDVPGVFALGGSRQEAAERMEEALAAYADEMRRIGKSMPEPVHASGTVGLPASASST